MSYTVHTKESAPQASKPILEQIEAAFGFIPNMSAVLAESPATLTTYATVTGILEQNALLTPQEQQVVMLTVSSENGCTYCTAAHTKLASMKNVPVEVVEAIQNGKAPTDPKFAALTQVTRKLIQERGRLDTQGQQAFFAAGYEKAHLLDVITIIALKTISNYVNHIAETPLDPAFS